MSQTQRLCELVGHGTADAFDILGRGDSERQGLHVWSLGHQGPYGAFLSQGGTPIAGWFLSWKIPRKWMMTGGTPNFRKPPYIVGLYQ